MRLLDVLSAGIKIVNLDLHLEGREKEYLLQSAKRSLPQKELKQFEISAGMGKLSMVGHSILTPHGFGHYGKPSGNARGLSRPFYV
jgi:hypothetical protein